MRNIVAVYSIPVATIFIILVHYCFSVVPIKEKPRFAGEIRLNRMGNEDLMLAVLFFLVAPWIGYFVLKYIIKNIFGYREPQEFKVKKNYPWLNYIMGTWIGSALNGLGMALQMMKRLICLGIRRTYEAIRYWGPVDWFCDHIGDIIGVIMWILIIGTEIMMCTSRVRR